MAREPVWFRCCSVHFTAIIWSHSKRSSPELRVRTQQPAAAEEVGQNVRACFYCHGLKFTPTFIYHVITN